MTLIGKSSGFGNMWKDIPEENRGKVVKLDDLKKEIPGLKIVDVYPNWDFDPERHVGMERNELVDALRSGFGPFKGRAFFYGTEHNYGGYVGYNCVSCSKEDEIILGMPTILGDGKGQFAKDRGYCTNCKSQIYEAHAF